MPTFSAGDTTARILVVGLLIQQPDTVAGVNRRLMDQFASARWAKGAAHNNMRSLEEKGYIRVIECGPQDEPTRDRYEATPKGVELFRRWVRTTKLPPAVRDALQCKLELLEHEDLVALVQLVREEEQAYTAACDIARARVIREQRARLISVREFDWHARLRSIRNKDEANLWGLMSKRLERLGDELEQLLNDMSPSRAG